MWSDSSLCGFCCGCGWCVIPDTHYTLTRKHHFSACTLYIAHRLLAALTPRHTRWLNFSSRHFTRESVSVFIRRWRMDNKLSWLRGWASPAVSTTSPYYGYDKRHWCPYTTQTRPKVCCTSLSAYVRNQDLVLIPNLAAKVKRIGFPDDLGYGTFLWQKSLLHKYNRNYLHCSRTFAASLLRFGPETTA